MFSKTEKEKILLAIRTAEKNTSGEIRVHVEPHCREEVLDRAAYLFKALHMHKTRQRNGVLFYIAYKDHKFAILGDAGINSVVPGDFWEQIKEEMAGFFRKNEFVPGLEKGIITAGEQLKGHFPYRDDDVNELPDEISVNVE